MWLRGDFLRLCHEQVDSLMNAQFRQNATREEGAFYTDVGSAEYRAAVLAEFDAQRSDRYAHLAESRWKKLRDFVSANAAQ